MEITKYDVKPLCEYIKFVNGELLIKGNKFVRGD